MVRSYERNYLRAWREYRGLTQAKLADAVGTTGAVISLLESGERGLSDKWLRKLAPVLETTMGYLLEVDPKDADHDVMAMFAKIPEARRAQALAVMKTFTVETPAETPDRTSDKTADKTSGKPSTVVDLPRRSQARPSRDVAQGGARGEDD